MVDRYKKTYLVFLGGMMIGSFCTANAQSGVSRFFHPGEVKEMATGSPILSDATAWPELKRTNHDNGCPQFGQTPLDSRTTDPITGKYLFQIDPAVSVFTAVFCADGYEPHVRVRVANHPDRSPVRGTPAQLRPIDRSSIQNEELQRSFIDDILNALDDLLAAKSYSPEHFDAAVEQLKAELTERVDSDAATAFSQLDGAVDAWGLLGQYNNVQ